MTVAVLYGMIYNLLILKDTMTTYFDSLIDEAMHIADEVRVVADGLLAKYSLLYRPKHR